MFRATDGRICALAACALLLGCARTPVPDYPRFAVAAASAEPVSAAGAFEAYVAAAVAAESRAGKYLSRTNFTPGYRDHVVQLLEAPISQVVQAGSKTCSFPYEPQGPFARKPHRSAWRLIGMAIAWKASNLARDGDLDRALAYTVAATRFGFDLAGGDCSDAALGFSIADEARRSILPFVPQFSAQQLVRLRDGLGNATKRLAPLETAIENERKNMRLTVDAIQTAYRTNDYSAFEKELRQDIRPAVKHLAMLPPDSQERAKFFESLAEEADATARQAMAMARLNARQREGYERIQFDKGRPWRRWARYYFRAPEPLLAIRDRTIARTRLLAIHAGLLAIAKSKRALPKSLEEVDALATLSIDPYSGRPFIYRPLQHQYRLYSVGSDYRDDGGESDESFSTPDLVVESINL